MKKFARLMPSAPVPPLKVRTVGGPCWRLCDQKPKNFTLVVFYRGYHCRFCERQLRELETNYEAFCRLGVRVLAVSADSRERAERTAADWGIDQLTLCWGLTMDQARDWGLFISEGSGRSLRDVEEPPFFVEPAFFLVRPDGTLYASIVQTMPFARPRLEDIIDGIAYVIAHDATPRGASLGAAVDKDTTGKGAADADHAGKPAGGHGDMCLCKAHSPHEHMA